MTSCRTTVKLLLPVFFPALLFSQRNFIPELSAPVNVPAADTSQSGNLFAGKSKWVEDVSARTVYSSKWNTPDGRVIVQYSKAPLNYYDASGKLQRIDDQLKPTADGYAAMDQPYPVYFYNDGSAAVSTSKDGGQFRFGKNCFVNGKPAYAWNPVEVRENKIVTTILPGVEKQMQFRMNGVKYNYVLRQPIATPGNFLTVGEEIEIPQGYSLKRGERGREENNGWAGDYRLISPSGEVGAMIYAPVCFDAAGNTIIGTYKLKNESGKQILELLVPASWLNDPARAYPVTIDPLVTGPTALWTGPNMPSCISPAFNSDSILVTIPAQITIMRLVVTSSFYADPFTSAVMADGAMWFSTICDTSTTFTIGPPAGNTPGTAYLDTFNLRVPLMCCFPQDCNQRTFYLRMHLSRTGPGTGCNTTYIRHDLATTLWPFSAFVEGRTVEAYGQQWSVPSTPKCSDECTITATTYIRYGVPPFTITHPWMSGSVTAGNPGPCTYSASPTPLTLTIPNCPMYCDTVTVLAVPPPTVIDQCGNVVTGMPTRYVPIKQTPQLVASPNPDTLCSGEPVNITWTPCLAGSTVAWSGNNTSGSGNISDVIFNTGTAATSTTYYAQATLNGCTGDSATATVVVDPVPVAAFNYSTPAIAGVPVNFADATPVYAGTANSWYWDFGNGNQAVTQNASQVYPDPGTYVVCFTIGTDHGCSDTVCRTIEVIPAEVEVPNVITPNADGVNDLLVFRYLEFYTNNKLEIYDRWGALLYTKNSYANDWDGSKYVDGTYYYVLTIQENGQLYKGFFQIIR